MEVRLQKFLANAGVASRRKSESMILSGRVKINGKIITELGIKIDPEVDEITVEGVLVKSESSQRLLYALYKPKNCITSLDDPQGRDTVVNYFPKTKSRLFPIGRLDYDAEGLVLLTNDGELANNIAHPSKHIWKQYFVKIKGKITPQVIKKLSKGPMIDGIKRQPVKINLLHYINEKTWLHVYLQEGINHHLKKMFKEVGFPVQKIKRYSVGNIELGEMTPGTHRLLAKAEIEELLALTGQ